MLGEKQTYLKVPREQVQIRVSTVSQILEGKFNKDQGIRFTDYFNRDRTKNGFIVLTDVKVHDINTREFIEETKFLAVNVQYIVTATEISISPEEKK